MSFKTLSIVITGRVPVIHTVVFQKTHIHYEALKHQVDYRHKGGNDGGLRAELFFGERYWVVSFPRITKKVLT